MNFLCETYKIKFTSSGQDTNPTTINNKLNYRKFSRVS